MTIGLIEYINNNDTKLYDKIRIFGYDIPEYLHSLNPRFNYVTRSRKEMGIQIANLMVNKIKKTSTHTSTVIIEPILV